jgi:hypothetical protein
MDLSTKLKITAVMAAVLMAVVWAVPVPVWRKTGALRVRAEALPEALDPLGQRLRTPAKRRVRRRFVSAHCVLAGHEAFGQGILVEVGAQARHSVGDLPMPTPMSARCFAQVSCSSWLFMRPIVRRAGALARMSSAKGDKRASPVDTRGSRSERDRRQGPPKA